MAPLSTRANYKSELPPDNTESRLAGPRADDFALVEETLQLLARAVRQFHTYPPTSPLCADAIAACQKTLVSLEHRDRLTIRATPTRLIVDEVSVGAGTIVEPELVRRLHQARVIGLEIDRAATTGHLSHLCSNLILCDSLSKTDATLNELLAEQGVDTIVLTMAHVPEVVDIGAGASPAVCDLVGREQQRRRATPAFTGPVDYLYPPDKGWVRLDPAARLDDVSLVDLAVLVNDPAEMAAILLRLTDDDPVGAEERKSALEHKFSDVTMLFSSLDPRLARVMFGKLARAVLELEPERRKNLLRRTILPGLLDGRADGTVLSDFPDVDLADSLCLLLELETAAPEVLTAALNRLDLSPERKQAVVPLIDARLRGDGAGQAGRSAEPAEREIDRLARRLIRVDRASGKDFSEFAAFDLSIDQETAAGLAGARGVIGATDVACTQLRFLANLVRLEPNPKVVEAFLRRALGIFNELQRSGRWTDLAEGASRFRQLGIDLLTRRPDVAIAIEQALTTFQTPSRVAAIVDLVGRGGDEARTAHSLVDSFGDSMTPGLVALLESPAHQSNAAAAVSLMCEHASLFAPSLIKLHSQAVSTTRVIMKVLGFAGPGYEAAVGEQLGHGDDTTAREALRALARIGSNRAASLVVREIQGGHPVRGAAAEEALWHFPPPKAASHVRDLLGNHEFVTQHPDAAARLLARAAHTGTSGLESVLAGLEPLRFHFWNPALVRVALKARELRTR